MTTRTKEDVILLVQAVQDGSEEAFSELEGIAKPLLVSLSNRFSNYHYKFEFEDFYSIGLMSLYRACQSFKTGNPSFLDYAKLVILRSFWREIEYWNQEKRNVFAISEVEIENAEDFPYEYDLVQFATMNEFRRNLSKILDECFDQNKSQILKMHILSDMKICDIAIETKQNYKYVHKVIERGTKKIQEEYIERYILDNSDDL